MQAPAISGGTKTSAAPAEHAVYVWGIALGAALGGLLFGYDWVVIGGARQFFEVYFRLSSPELIGWANSCALVGCLIGSLAAGYFADRFGRRRILLIAGVLFAISSALTGWAYSFSTFIMRRIVGGVAIGLSSNIAPLYIAEISPAAIRGRLVSLNQFAIVVGILLAQIVNWGIAQPVVANLTADAALHSWNVQYGWRWMFSAIVIPSLLFIAASLFLPESPRWLLTHNQKNEACTVLARIGGAAYAESELASIDQSLSTEKEQKSSWQELLRPRIRRIVLIGIVLAALQQWTGINILFNYAAEVYRSAGFGANDIFLNIVITGAINLVFTVLAMMLVDKLGRRSLMLFGCIGIGASHLLCGFAYRAGWPAGIVLALTLCAIACYALTLAPVTWVLIAEIFPNRVRSHGVSAAVSGLWIASFLLTYTFPMMNTVFGSSGIFFIYGLICLAGFLFVSFFVTETKGRTLEQIEAAVTTAQT